MFLKAMLKNGDSVVAEFSRLGSGQRYAAQVFAGQKPFNAWRIVARQHPVTGEQTLIRSRQMINGSEIVSIEQVKPTTPEHGYEPQFFEPVTEMQRGQFGLWVGPSENTPEGVQAGVEYPIHRDPQSLRRYVITATRPEETRHWIDAAEGVYSPVSQTEPDDADDDFGDGAGDEDEDDRF